MKKFITVILVVSTLFFYCSDILAQSIFVKNVGEHQAAERYYDLLLDGDYMWIATAHYIVKYDKVTQTSVVYDAKSSGLPGLHIKLAKDRHKDLIWLTTLYSGIGTLDENGKWTSYTTVNSGLPHDQLNGAILIDDKNNKWIGSAWYLAKYDDFSWKSWDSDVNEATGYFSYNDMVFDEDGVLWLGASNTSAPAPAPVPGVWVFAKFIENEIIPITTSYRSVLSLVVDQKNSIWMGTQTDGLIKYDRETFMQFNVSNSDLPSDCVFDIEIDKQGDLWMACGKYLVKFDGTEFTKYALPNDAEAYKLAIDESYHGGGIWVETFYDGIFFFTNNGFQQLDSPVSIPKNNIDNLFHVFSTQLETVIDFTLTNTSSVSISIFDMQGKEISRILDDSKLTSGKHTCRWTHLSVPHGVYLVRYVVNGNAGVKKIAIP
jgi:ligand-binding sensor domain-containing protein